MKIKAFQNKEVTVFGLGKSGLATAKQLHAGKAHVTVWDDNKSRQDQARDAGLQVTDILNPEWTGSEYLILSPGVPLTHPAPHPVVEKARQTETEIIGDIEVFLLEKTAGKIVGITGTNGKSTTTALVNHLLCVNGRETAVGGNIGTPVLEMPELGQNGVCVLELSSYQLDLTPSWKADIALLLNVTPDHLDRHGDMAGYVSVKERIFQNQSENDIAVINYDDPICYDIARRLSKKGKQRLIPISVESELPNGVSVVDGLLRDCTESDHPWCMDISKIERLRGRHNWQNAAAAVAIVRAFDLTDAEIEKGLSSFEGLAHRMELVAIKEGVRLVNDSKATNAQAAEKALASFDNIFWICGGIPKAGGIDSLVRYFPKINHAYLIGEAEDRFAGTLKGQVPFTKCHDLTTATVQALQDAKACGADATVLLSPAAASFDQFSSFEARGDAFRDLVGGQGS